VLSTWALPILVSLTRHTRVGSTAKSADKAARRQRHELEGDPGADVTLQNPSILPQDSLKRTKTTQEPVTNLVVGSFSHSQWKLVEFESNDKPIHDWIGEDGDDALFFGATIAHLWPSGNNLLCVLFALFWSDGTAGVLTLTSLCKCGSRLAYWHNVIHKKMFTRIFVGTICE